MLTKIAVALSFTLPSMVWANSASYYGAAGALMPVAERRVTMLSEDIRFHQGAARSRWRIVARYRFINRSAKAVKIDLGFPLIARIGEGPRYRRSNPFRYSFKVYVNSKRVPYVAKRQGCDSMAKRLKMRRDRESARFCYDFVHIVPVRFEPGKPVEVVYRYWQRTSADNSRAFWFVDYILETGALWGGPIESATFSFRFAHPTGRLLVNDKLFHRYLMHEWIDCAINGNPPGRCQRGEIEMGAGKVRLWSNNTEFSYWATCAKNGALHLRLHANNVVPRGNLAIGYIPATSRRESLCKVSP